MGETDFTDGNTWAMDDPNMGPGDSLGPGFNMRRDFQEWDPAAGDFPIPVQPNADTGADGFASAEMGYNTVAAQIGDGAKFCVCGGDLVFLVIPHEDDMIRYPEVGEPCELAFPHMAVNAWLAWKDDMDAAGGDQTGMVPQDFFDKFAYAGHCTGSAATASRDIKRITVLRMGDVSVLPIQQADTPDHRTPMSAVGFKLDYVMKAKQYVVHDEHKFQFTQLGDSAARVTTSDSPGMVIYESKEIRPCLQVIPYIFAEDAVVTSATAERMETSSADLTLAGQRSIVTGFYYEAPVPVPRLARSIKQAQWSDVHTVGARDMGHFVSPLRLFRHSIAM